MKDYNSKIVQKPQNKEITIEDIVYSFNISFPQYSISFLKTCSKLAMKSHIENEEDCLYSCMVWADTDKISVCFFGSGKVRYVELLVPTELGDEIYIE